MYKIKKWIANGLMIAICLSMLAISASATTVSIGQKTNATARIDSTVDLFHRYPLCTHTVSCKAG